eukprot:CAMPEP_0177650222 /NCGR_PEP_ID=MMETSP0447-20121125/11821_1 /TAXON_ID=0 /ORGANISM="Stygamoeba regulata, Strain BSH-02190019" /LENGTH=124 /DNA_ID=CAMNT_0019153065 /DNA_START=165 /DNA_END=539 /DNA_ORIENTATION=+
MSVEEGEGDLLFGGQAEGEGERYLRRGEGERYPRGDEGRRGGGMGGATSPATRRRAPGPLKGDRAATYGAPLHVVHGIFCVAGIHKLDEGEALGPSTGGGDVASHKRTKALELVCEIARAQVCG